MKKSAAGRYSFYAVLGILLILVLILMIGAVDAANRGSGFLFISSYTPSPTNTATATNTLTATPTATNTLTATPTAADTATPVPSDTPVLTETSAPTDTPTAVPTATHTPLPTFDETAFVETFYMHVTETAEAFALLQTPSATPEIPDRDLRTGLETISLTDGKTLFYVKSGRRSGHLGFWIDLYEVTNGEYRRCVEAGACKLPKDTACGGIGDYYDSEAYRSFPVVNITRRQAADYCEWAGMELMALRDWEASAAVMDTEGANINMNARMPVDNGSSNIIGNVWEWTRDYYEGGRFIIAGGSWKTSASDIRMMRNGSTSPAKYAEDLGFRCVRYVK